MPIPRILKFGGRVRSHCLLTCIFLLGGSADVGGLDIDKYTILGSIRDGFEFGIGIAARL
jgi:hypothetical protein